MTASSVLTRGRDSLVAMDPLLLLLRASLIVVLANSNDDVFAFLAIALVSVVALPRPRVIASPLFWAAAFVLIASRQLPRWHELDDHVIVTTYWCGAIALALTAADRRATLAASARFLIGSVFACAVAWKVASPEFVDGSFFRWSLLFDHRFEVVSRVLGGTGDAVRAANIDGANALLAGEAFGEVALQEGSRIHTVARVFTWWGLATESAIAVTFLLPVRERLAWLRHASLAAFAGTTYFIVPVTGFGVLLFVLGAAQTKTERGRLAYLTGGIALLAWSTVWPPIFT